MQICIFQIYVSGRGWNEPPVIPLNQAGAAFVQMIVCKRHVLRRRDVGHACMTPVSQKEREELIERLTREMKAAAKILEFEHAAALRDRIEKLRQGK